MRLYPRWMAVLFLLFAALGLSGCPVQPPDSPDAVDAPEASAPRESWDDDEVLVKLGEEGSLTYRDMKRIWLDWRLNDELLSNLAAEEQTKFFNRVYTAALFSREARERGLDKSPEYQAAMLPRYYSELDRVYRRVEIVDKIRPSDEELIQYIALALPEVRLRMIMKRDAEQAQALYQRAVAGEDFAELARAESEGLTRHKGGDSGWHSAMSGARLPAPVVERLLELEVGAIAEPFYQDIGFLVVKVEDKRSGEEVRRLELERKRQALITDMHAEEYNRRLKEWREAAEIVIHDDVIAALRADEAGLDTVVLEVNGEAYSARGLLADMLRAGAHGGGDVHNRVAKFADTALVGQEAQRLGLEQRPEFVARWQNLELRELGEYMVATVNAEAAGEGVTDAELAAYMEARPEEFVEPEARHLRVIVLTSAADRDVAQSRLAAGEAFAAVAAELSQNADTAVKGGDMGWLDVAAIPPVVWESVEPLAPGQVTEPAVETTSPDGSPLYLLVKVEAVRNAATLPLERAKTPKVMARLRAIKRTKALSTLYETLGGKFGYEVCF